MWANMTLKIQIFDRTAKLSSYPIEFYPGRDTVCKKLMTRRPSWIELNEILHMLDNDLVYSYP